MASTKGRFVRLLSGFVLKRASVVAAEDVGGFRKVVLRSDVEAFPAGSKLQILLPSDDMRTYSPIATREGPALLGWKHAGGPGAQFVANAKAGDELLFVGPQRSLELPPGPVILVGDETSVAVAAAFAAERPDQLHAVLHAAPASDVPAAAASVGLPHLDVVPSGDIPSTVERVTSRLSATPGATVALTGGSTLILALRAALRSAGVNNVKSKTYWIPGKAGLD